MMVNYHVVWVVLNFIYRYHLKSQKKKKNKKKKKNNYKENDNY